MSVSETVGVTRFISWSTVLFAIAFILSLIAFGISIVGAPLPPRPEVWWWGVAALVILGLAV